MTTKPLQETEPVPAETGYAVTLRVQRRICVVVGGGPVGERKARELHHQGAHVVVIAPQITDTLSHFVETNLLEYRATGFTPEMLTGAFLVIAATNNPEVNQQVLEAARAQGVLSNAAGAVPGDCPGDFETMATVQRGYLQIAVTTGGASPALSTRIKNQIAETWGPEWTDWVRLLAQVRQQAKSQLPDPTYRAEFLRRLASRDDLRDAIARGETTNATNQAEQMLREAIDTVTEGQIACPAR